MQINITQTVLQDGSFIASACYIIANKTGLNIKCMARCIADHIEFATYLTSRYPSRRYKIILYYSLCIEHAAIKHTILYSNDDNAFQAMRKTKTI